ncbi:glycosyltransferase [Neotamlana laminarinivorans]|uniref:Glycosyltransferase n=1 Tax=Neotamlana laminarinivorans TaxID=2883124 RepID=A0A9X1I157_9FLAO|nr:glycosyltransferase [Tamlana laminarinivorans]MCB4799525.1 glycosyltransferase [Tamlana laminarinivorans]
MKPKICLLTDSLSSGGAEKMVANLSVSFSKKGYEVVIVLMNDNIDYNFKGRIFNFGKIKATHSIFTSFLKLRTFVKYENFDVILDHRVRDKFLKEFAFAQFIFKKAAVVYCVHSYKLNLYFSTINKKPLTRFTLVKNREIVTVSKEIKDVLNSVLSLNSTVIYNYPMFKENKKVELQELPEKYIIAVGRLDKIKQFDVLIKCYKNSNLSSHNIKLLILGEGKEKRSLANLIDRLNLDDYVHLKGFVNNPEKYIKNAKALVMSSVSEGFPMVLIEAMALKTPCVSFDCYSGPNEIIKHNINGILVEKQNKEELTKAMDKLLLDDVFYASIKRNLQSDELMFSEEKILKQWVKIISK